MASTPKNPTEAQALKARREADGRKAMAEYEANAVAVRAKTERLRALRLAQEAAQPPAATAAKPAKAKSSSAKSTKAAKKADPGKLSDWIKKQQDSGRTY